MCIPSQVSLLSDVESHVLLLSKIFWTLVGSMKNKKRKGGGGGMFFTLTYLSPKKANYAPEFSHDVSVRQNSHKLKKHTVV